MQRPGGVHLRSHSEPMWLEEGENKLKILNEEETQPDHIGVVAMLGLWYV